jgi:hypothetical protein
MATPQVSNVPIAPPIFTPFLLYGAGQISKADLFYQIYGSKWVQLAIALGLSLLLAFEHELHIFNQKQTFLALLAITVALVFLEYEESPGLVLLMAALTAISFQLAWTAPSSSPSEH